MILDIIFITLIIAGIMTITWRMFYLQDKYYDQKQDIDTLHDDLTDLQTTHTTLKKAYDQVCEELINLKKSTPTRDKNGKFTKRNNII